MVHRILNSKFRGKRETRPGLPLASSDPSEDRRRHGAGGRWPRHRRSAVALLEGERPEDRRSLEEVQPVGQVVGFCLLPLPPRAPNTNTCFFVYFFSRECRNDVRDPRRKEATSWMEVVGFLSSSTPPPPKLHFLRSVREVGNVGMNRKGTPLKETTSWMGL